MWCALSIRGHRFRARSGPPASAPSSKSSGHRRPDHISDMAGPRGCSTPSEVVKSDEWNVVILNIDAENKRISLGLKQAEEDPWLRIGETYPIGLELRGRAVRLMDKGVVVDLGNDIEGFVPMSQLGVANIENPGDAVKEGQPLDLKVLEVDPIITDRARGDRLSGRADHPPVRRCTRRARPSSRGPNGRTSGSSRGRSRIRPPRPREVS